MEHVVCGLPGPAVGERVEGPAGPARLGHACAQPPPKLEGRRPGGAGTGGRGGGSRRDSGFCRRPRLCEFGLSRSTRGTWGGVLPSTFFFSVLSLSAFKLQDLINVDKF